jgi:hypothetical protein
MRSRSTPLGRGGVPPNGRYAKFTDITRTTLVVHGKQRCARAANQGLHLGRATANAWLSLFRFESWLPISTRKSVLGAHEDLKRLRNHASVFGPKAVRWHREGAQASSAHMRRRQRASARPSKTCAVSKIHSSLPCLGFHASPRSRRRPRAKHTLGDMDMPSSETSKAGAAT